MSWISKILGKDEPGEPGAVDAQDGGSDAVADTVVEAVAGEATETAAPSESTSEHPVPVQEPPGEAGAGPDHAGIVASLRAHLTAVAEKHDQPLRPDELRDDADLFEAGYLDSLMASEFLVLAEKQFGVPLPDWLIGGKANTLETLARYIADEMPST